ncbi:MAG: hypothetical protein GXY52_01240 [Chloroflexi bacterium]|nr:hypothetical protein [Chloroflexota bacterium]
MLDYIDTDRQKKPASILRISGLIVLLAAVATFGYYLFSYGLPEMKSASAQVTAPTAMPTVQPAQAVQVTTRPVDSTDLVLPTNGSYLATGTNNATRAWFRRVPAEVLRNHIYAWGLEHHTEYAQKYYLSCEAAVIRIALAPLGIHLTEDRILSEIPFSDDDPEQGMVIGDIDGYTHFDNGEINWGNYGAHAPVLAKMFKWYLVEYGMDDLVSVEIQALDDWELRDLIRTDPDVVGVVIWVARGPDGGLPPTNEIGQVLGEHVQWVAPVLDEEGRLLVFDVWPWPNQPFHYETTLNRQLFQNRTVILRRINAAS